ncbi:unnamed protein product [Vitrella brassicaformis CCMP3155]|uniref:SnoaL-like domain-containing protein n=2 Tax=Vitrella brassicaformis TaxID=1169539 RepID=A0A0G4EUR0_VITBC|nr:unnamed protein product [Vitrella brassicaformis CCMP3155]|eukprot:CEM02066.1 unnamed protein product [Vitrella brassicaformis CCMP3155]
MVMAMLSVAALRGFVEAFSRADLAALSGQSGWLSETATLYQFDGYVATGQAALSRLYARLRDRVIHTTCLGLWRVDGITSCAQCEIEVDGRPHCVFYIATIDPTDGRIQHLQEYGDAPCRLADLPVDQEGEGEGEGGCGGGGEGEAYGRVFMSAPLPAHPFDETRDEPPEGETMERGSDSATTPHHKRPRQTQRLLLPPSLSGRPPAHFSSFLRRSVSRLLDGWRPPPKPLPLAPTILPSFFSMLERGYVPGLASLFADEAIMDDPVGVVTFEGVQDIEMHLRYLVDEWQVKAKLIRTGFVNASTEGCLVRLQFLSRRTTSSPPHPPAFAPPTDVYSWTDEGDGADAIGGGVHTAYFDQANAESPWDTGAIAIELSMPTFTVLAFVIAHVATTVERPFVERLSFYYDPTVSQLITASEGHPSLAKGDHAAGQGETMPSLPLPLPLPLPHLPPSASSVQWPLFSLVDRSLLSMPTTAEGNSPPQRHMTVRDGIDGPPPLPSVSVSPGSSHGDRERPSDAAAAPTGSSARQREKQRGKVCLVTGGASGVGRAVALALLADGHTVVVADSYTEAEELQPQPAPPHDQGQGHFDSDEALQRLHPEQVDVSDPAQLQEVLEWTQQSFQTIDVLVNSNNGAIVHQPARRRRRPVGGKAEGEADEGERARSDPKHGVKRIREILHYGSLQMEKQREGGVIVNLFTHFEYMPTPTPTPTPTPALDHPQAGEPAAPPDEDHDMGEELLAGAKEELSMLTRQAADELAPKGIRVVGVCVTGRIPPPLTAPAPAPVPPPGSPDYFPGEAETHTPVAPPTPNAIPMAAAAAATPSPSPTPPTATAAVGPSSTRYRWQQREGRLSDIQEEGESMSARGEGDHEGAGAGQGDVEGGDEGEGEGEETPLPFHQLERLVELGGVVHACKFLVGKSCSGVTGVTLPIDLDIARQLTAKGRRERGGRKSALLST